MIQEGCPIDDHNVPDISVGRTWSSFWVDNDFDSRFTPRQKHPHEFPESFPQASMNPVDAWIYPSASLGEFRIWLQTYYIPEKFPAYVEGKVRKGAFIPSRAELMLQALGHRPTLVSAT